MTWSQLPAPAKAFRIAHALWGVVSMAALSYIWTCAALRRRDSALAASVGWLLIEGGALVVGRGNCPAGPLQRELGDPKPLFELILPPRAAKAAIPILAGVTIAGLVAVAARPPRDARRSMRGQSRSRISRRFCSYSSAVTRLASRSSASS
jgi:hypothetical protein